ncbi:MAG: hypothetical protein JWM59_2697 [Verrucomicrobiales bacterium]|nr:hypothetical protein [Verrucomicrobiales bacterium]
MATEPFIRSESTGPGPEEILPSCALTSAVDKLIGMQDGWLEGGGTAPARKTCPPCPKTWWSFSLLKCLTPGVVPTEEGNVSLEWIRPAAGIGLEVNFVDRPLELYPTDPSTDTFAEEHFGWEEWPQAFEKISALL